MMSLRLHDPPSSVLPCACLKELDFGVDSAPGILRLLCRFNTPLLQRSGRLQYAPTSSRHVCTKQSHTVYMQEQRQEDLFTVSVK